MRKVRSGHTATLPPDGRVLVTGGYDEKGAERAGVELMGRVSAELYDPRTGQWTATGSMPQAQAGHTATLLADGRVRVAGAKGGNDAELYDPGSGRWASRSDRLSRHGTLGAPSRRPDRHGLRGQPGQVI